jgi:hypothetical protein
VKRIMLALAAIALFLTTSALPSRAYGNPESKCYPYVCPPSGDLLK